MTTRDAILDILAMVSCIGLIFMGCLWFLNRPDFNQQAVRAIVGEASNQTPDTMVCIAHAIRNRGNLHGVYGLQAKHIWYESPKVWREAAIAWDASGLEADVVGGAKNFGTAQDLQDLGIDNDDDHLIRCGDFYFY